MFKASLKFLFICWISYKELVGSMYKAYLPAMFAKVAPNGKPGLVFAVVGSCLKFVIELGRLVALFFICVVGVVGIIFCSVVGVLSPLFLLIPLPFVVAETYRKDNKLYEDMKKEVQGL